MTPYYDDGQIVIYHGDCRDILRPCRRSIWCSTDPPYGINHPTDYADRGRAILAPCRDYPRVYGDAEPFDPAPWLSVGRARILWSEPLRVAATVFGRLARLGQGAARHHRPSNVQLAGPIASRACGGGGGSGMAA